MSFEMTDLLNNTIQIIMRRFNDFETRLEGYLPKTGIIRSFIGQCQNLIKNGWNKEIDDIDNNKVSFFLTILKPLLVEVRAKAKENFSPNDEKVVNYFVRLFLFRFLFNMHKIYPCVEDGNTWFAEIKIKLDNEFKSFCDSFSPLTVMYNGKTIKNIQELQRAITIKENQVNCLNNNASYGKEWSAIPAILGMALYAYLITVSESDRSGLKSTALIFLAVGVILYKMHILNQSQQRQEARHSLASLKLYQSEFQDKEVVSNKDIQKFFFVSDEEITALSDCRERSKKSTIQ